MYTWVEALKDIGRKLNDRINETPNNATLKSLLAEKANTDEVIKKGYGTLNDFDEDSRRQILGMETGEINAVLGRQNVKPDNIFGINEVWKSVNCLNPSNATIGSRLSYYNNEYTIVSDKNSAYSGYIEVEVGDKFTIDKTSGNGSLVCIYYDENNNPIGKIFATGYGASTIEVTNSDYKKIRINIVIQNRDISEVMIARGEIYPSAYQPYEEGVKGGIYSIPWLKAIDINSIGANELKNGSVTEEKISNSLKDELFKDKRIMSLPKRIFYPYNKECKIYYKSIMNSKYFNFIYKSTYSEGKYKIRDRYYTLGTITATKSDIFYVYDDKTENLISSEQIEVVCTNPESKIVDTQKNILIIGDSFIQGEIIPDRIKEKLIDSFGFLNFNFIGGKSTTKGVKHQGMGGYGFSDFVCLPEERRNDFNINPFWNDIDNNLDFKKYLLDLSVNGDIDYCIIHLGVNDMLAWGIDGNSIVEKAKKFIDKLHIDYPNCKILLSGVVVQSEKNNFHSAYMHNKRAFILNKAYESFAEEDKYKDFLTYVDTCATFDRDYAYPYEIKQVCEGSIETEKVLKDYLHPNEAGYYMIADNIISAILYNI